MSADQEVLGEGVLLRDDDRLQLIEEVADMRRVAADAGRNGDAQRWARVLAALERSQPRVPPRVGFKDEDGGPSGPMGPLFLTGVNVGWVIEPTAEKIAAALGVDLETL